jgi:hypothetical protein
LDDKIQNRGMSGVCDTFGEEERLLQGSGTEFLREIDLIVDWRIILTL